VTSGLIGVHTRMKFGCVGDAMNVASRVKGLCKLYKVGIIFTENCIVDDSDFFVSRELDVVRGMDKSEPTKIFQLVGLED